VITTEWNRIKYLQCKCVHHVFAIGASFTFSLWRREGTKAEKRRVRWETHAQKESRNLPFSIGDNINSAGEVECAAEMWRCIARGLRGAASTTRSTSNHPLGSHLSRLFSVWETLSFLTILPFFVFLVYTFNSVHVQSLCVFFYFNLFPFIFTLCIS